jgi:alkylation response protein AidB-like acyl-CoA dehydrogenase
MLDDWKINWEWHDLPPEVWAFIKAKKFFGMIIPKEYGGLGFSRLCAFGSGAQDFDALDCGCVHRDGAELARAG